MKASFRLPDQQASDGILKIKPSLLEDTNLLYTLPSPIPEPEPGETTYIPDFRPNPETVHSETREYWTDLAQAIDSTMVQLAQDLPNTGDSNGVFTKIADQEYIQKEYRDKANKLIKSIVENNEDVYVAIPYYGAVFYAQQLLNIGVAEDKLIRTDIRGTEGMNTGSADALKPLPEEFQDIDTLAIWRDDIGDSNNTALDFVGNRTKTDVIKLKQTLRKAAKAGDFNNQTYASAYNEVADIVANANVVIANDVSKNAPALQAIRQKALGLETSNNAQEKEWATLQLKFIGRSPDDPNNTTFEVEPEWLMGPADTKINGRDIYKQLKRIRDRMPEAHEARDILSKIIEFSAKRGIEYIAISIGRNSALPLIAMNDAKAGYGQLCTEAAVTLAQIIATENKQDPEAVWNALEQYAKYPEEKAA